MVEEKAAGEWSQTDMLKLIIALRSNLGPFCEFRLAFPGRTCGEVSDQKRMTLTEQIYDKARTLLADPGLVNRVCRNSSTDTLTKTARKRKGCRCKSDSSKRRISCDNDNCECFRGKRECDPDLCGACIGPEYLNLSDMSDKSKRRCGNAFLQTHTEPVGDHMRP